VDLTIALGLVLAALAAFATDVGFLQRHRGAADAPEVDIRKPVATVVGLFKSKWWSIGFGVAFISWVFHVASLKLAPLSLVQAVLASGFVMLAIIAERWFGFSVGKREWIGIGLTTVGLALLGITATEASSSRAHASYPLGGAIAFEGGLVALGVLAFMVGRSGRGQGQRGVLLGATAGLLFTVSHIGIKALSGQIDISQPVTLLTPWMLVIVAAFVGAFFASARSLQVGEAVPVIAVTSAISNVTAILGGIVVFGDPLGNDALTISARVFAFILVVVAAALIPAPVRAAGHRDEPKSSSPEGRSASSKAAPSPAAATGA
jgi:drug/metabolite transporter (DMT)-like permease